MYLYLCVYSSVPAACFLLNLEQGKNSHPASRPQGLEQWTLLSNCVFKSKRLTRKGSQDGKGNIYPIYEAPLKAGLIALNGAYGEK